MGFLPSSTSTMSADSTGEPLRGCMKVTTLNESLASCRRSHLSILPIFITSRRRVTTVGGDSSSEKLREEDSNSRRGLVRVGRKRSGLRSFKSDGSLQRLSRSQRFVNYLKDSIEPRRKKMGEVKVKRRSSVVASIRNLALHRFLRDNELYNMRNDDRLTNVKSVKFLDVFIREYEVIATDNPAVSWGTAIGLGWKYSILDSQNIEEFEEKRSKERSKDFLREKRLQFTDREKILREFGVTEQEIFEAAEHAASIRDRRDRSVENMSYDKMSYYIELGVDKMKRSFGRLNPMKRSKSCDDIRLHPSLFTMYPV